MAFHRASCAPLSGRAGDCDKRLRGGSDVPDQGKPVSTQAYWIAICCLASYAGLTSNGGIRSLLIVDDNEVSRYILREILMQPWLQIEELSNGTSALERLEQRPPDAMILDLLMPDMSGFEVLRSLARIRRKLLIFRSLCIPQSLYRHLRNYSLPTGMRPSCARKTFPVDSQQNLFSIG